jgi:hypothetical protein
MAIFTVLEGIEAQLRGLKTLLAASNGSTTVTGKTTQVPQYDPMSPNQLTPEDEDFVAQQLGIRDAQVQKMAEAAGHQLQQIWQDASKEADKAE